VSSRKPHSKNKSRESIFDLHPDIYEAMIPWEKRLARELPFIQSVLEKNRVRKVLDIGCGPGHHAVALQQAGYKVTGLDNSLPMVKYARNQALKSGSSVRFIQGDVLKLAATLSSRYDAIMALGNMLAGLPDKDSLEMALEQIHACLNPGGVFFLQVLNYQKLLVPGAYDIPPRPFEWKGTPGLFLRHFEKETNQVQTAFILLLQKEGQWESEFHLGHHLLFSKKLLKESLLKAGFTKLKFRSGYEIKPSSPPGSNDIIVVANA